jgi:hypothetical protein
MSKKPSIIVWLDREELPDLYTLLGKRRLDPDVTGLQAAVSAAARELMPYQNHADAGKARRAMNLLTQLGRVESLLSDERRLTEVNKQLLDDITARCVARFSAPESRPTHDELRAWLEREEEVSPAALDEVQKSAWSALLPPSAAARPVRVFAAAPAQVSHASEAASAPSCPDCGCMVAKGALICIACGYDFRTGQKLTTRTSRSPAAPQRSPRSGAAGKKKPAAGKAPRSFLADHAWLARAALASAAAMVVVVAGAIWLWAMRNPGHEPQPDGEAAVAVASKSDDGLPRKAQQEAASTAGNMEPFPEDVEADVAEKGATGLTVPEARAPQPSVANVDEAKQAFDFAYKEALAAAPQAFDAAWAKALKLAPNADSRRLAHRAKIAELIKSPAPLPLAALEKLCAAYDLYLGDAQSVGERLTIVDSLAFSLAQKKSLEAGLARYVSLPKKEDATRDAIVRRLTQECLSAVSMLPTDQRPAACERVVSLAGGDAETRLAAYRLLASDALVMSRVSLDKLWEVYDAVLTACWLRAICRHCSTRCATVAS